MTRNQGGNKTGRTTEQAKQQGRQVVSRAGQQAKSQLGTQKERAAGQLHGVAQALHQTGQQLREQDRASFGEYADKAAEQVERVSGYLREKNPDQLISEAESLARRQPALFLGGAFALGLLGARFLKSSSQDGGSSGGGTQADSSTQSYTSQSGTTSGSAAYATSAGPGEGVLQEPGATVAEAGSVEHSWGS